MKQDIAIPSVIEKFRKQQKQMLKLYLAFLALILVGLGVPGSVRYIPALQGSPFLRVLGILWGCLVGVMFLILAAAALAAQRCPACNRLLGEEFWSARYCPNCGTKLSGNA